MPSSFEGMSFVPESERGGTATVEKKGEKALAQLQETMGKFTGEEDYGKEDLEKTKEKLEEIRGFANQLSGKELATDFTKNEYYPELKRLMNRADELSDGDFTKSGEKFYAFLDLLSDDYKTEKQQFLDRYTKAIELEKVGTKEEDYEIKGEKVYQEVSDELNQLNQDLERFIDSNIFLLVEDEKKAA